MDKPDFGLDRLFIIHWTEERVAWLRHCAEAGMSAAQIAVAIGLGASGGPRIAQACKLRGIKTQGSSGRPSRRKLPVVIEVPDAFGPALETLAIKYGLTRLEIAHRLLAAIFEQGETFLDNLLDLEPAG